MSLLDMAGKMMGGQGGDQNALSAVLNMVSNHPGGLGGLLSAFQQNGLGSATNSWVSNGPNQPVSGQDVQNTLGSSQIQEVAQNLGVPHETASSVIAQFLPSIVDHLTPNGQVPSGNSNLLEMGAGLLKNFMR